MVEWFKAHAWKACELRGSAGSNPVLCAKFYFAENRMYTSRIQIAIAILFEL